MDTLQPGISTTPINKPHNTFSTNPRVTNPTPREMSNQSTSMASVWDTLNRMKARQANAGSKTPRQHTTHRKDAIALFEREILAAANAGHTDGHVVLTKMRTTMDADEHVRSIVEEYQQRVTDDPTSEVANLKSSIANLRDELGLAASSMTRANDIALRLKLELGS